MKILQIVHCFPPISNAGAEKYAYFLSNELAKHHEVHVLYPVEGQPYLQIEQRQDSLLVRHELKITKPMQWSQISNYVHFENSYMNQEISKSITNLVLAIKPDVVHIQHLLYLSATVVDILAQLNIPIVLTLHDFWFMCPVVQLIRYSGEVCQGPQPDICRQCWLVKQRDSSVLHLQRHLPIIPQFILGTFANIVLNQVNGSEKFTSRKTYFQQLLLKVDRIVAPSQFLRDMYVSNGVPENKIVYSEYGYAVESMVDASKPMFAGGQIQFGYIGRIAPEKGVHVLLDAFLRFPENQAQLYIYGGYDPAVLYVSELLEKVSNRTDVHFMGHTDDLVEAYSKLNVLIFPSVWYENCPLVLAERQLTQKPVVASNLGAIPEFVRDGIDGFLFEPGDVSDLHEKLMEFVHHPGLVSTFSDNIVVQPKTMSQQAHEIETIYQEVISESEIQ